MIKERPAFAFPGIPVFLLVFVASLALVAGIFWDLFVVMIPEDRFDPLILGLLLLAVPLAIVWAGLTIVNPNQARAIVFVGDYSGTVRRQGLCWVNPFTRRPRISTKVRNFESSKLKVNDHDGNPIEIAAVVVWRVTDTAEALFEVDDFENFVHVQAESAVRNLATSYPYDAHQDGQLALRSNPVEVSVELRREIQERLEKAGVEVIEARISHLAYAPEIANAMLRRQQANAVIAARARIVEGAVGMVQMALAALSEKQVVELDEERKAQMVSNLLVVLCSEHETLPVVNAGTLYS